MDKEGAVCIDIDGDNGILLSHKKQQHFAICRPGGYCDK